jgi:hypothetical protein
MAVAAMEVKNATACFRLRAIILIMDLEGAAECWVMREMNEQELCKRGWGSEQLP